MFYPEATADRCTAALLLEVDPVAMVRGRGGLARTVLAQYVNDRPYVASSFMSVAIAQILGPALDGRSKERPELAQTPIPLVATIEVLPCRGGEDFLHEVFDPLGYEIQAARYPLDENVSRLGAKSVLLGHALQDDHAQRIAHASLRPDPRLRQFQALLRRPRGVGEAPQARRGLAGHRIRNGRRLSDAT